MTIESIAQKNSPPQVFRLTVPQIVYTVKKKLQDTHSDNIAICYPAITERQLKALQRHFLSVKRGPFGFIEFRIQSKNTEAIKQ